MNPHPPRRGIPMPPPPPARRKKRVGPRRIHPQTTVSKFWNKYHSKAKGKVTSIFPRKLYRDSSAPLNVPRQDVRNAARSYEHARAECTAMVHAAVAHCDRTNNKFVDFDFDLETDFQMREFNCLYGLSRLEFHEPFGEESRRRQRNGPNIKRSLQAVIDSGLLSETQVALNVDRLQSCLAETDCDGNKRPRAVHRLDWIFESPQFVINGYSSTDIKQGNLGDCWWLAAVGNIAHRKDLMDKICVARDEECGVYGFVFYRDGEWIPTVVDDNLYLTSKDFGFDSDVYDSRGKKARIHKKQNQTGSEALYFSKCVDENETWLPLLEKAYAKAHGDYDAIEGGWAGSAVEDLTGGVTSMLLANRVLRKDRLWREMLGVDQEQSEFVFAVSAGPDSLADSKNGIVLSHAYSILKAVEVEDDNGKRVRLVKLRNPWGERSDGGTGEWHGPWSDGSREWTPSMIQKLRHEFADDGVFWMAYEDVLSNFKWVHRTRLFDQRWTVAQQWTSEPIGWVPGYAKCKFVIEIRNAGPTVIVLSKINERYFTGLEGQYYFNLEFILRRLNSPTTVMEARGYTHTDQRSVNCEVYLEAGTYEVVPKIVAERNTWRKPVEKVVRTHADKNPKKLHQIGMQYDLAHAKVGVLDEDAEQERQREKAKKKVKNQKLNQDKMQQMSDAMAKMQVAINDMRMELIQKEQQRGSEGSGKNRASHSEAQPGQKKRESEGKEEGGSESESDDESHEPSPKETPSPEAGSSEPKDQSTQTFDEPEPATSAGGKDDQKSESPPKLTSEDSKSSKAAGEDAGCGATKDAPIPAPQPTPAPAPAPAPGPISIPITVPLPAPPPHTLILDESSSSSSSSDSESDSDSDSSDSSVAPPIPGMPIIRKKRRNRNPPWNPVCVMGIRVYAQDKDLSVSLASQHEETQETSSDEEVENQDSADGKKEEKRTKKER